MTILLALIISGVIACVWFMFCNERTCAQRIAMMPSPADPQFRVKMDRRRSVSYDHHLWALILFRDPMKLYPKAPQ